MPIERGITKPVEKEIIIPVEKEITKPEKPKDKKGIIKKIVYEDGSEDKIEDLRLDLCPKVLIWKIPPRPPRGIPMFKKKEPSTTKVRI